MKRDGNSFYQITETAPKASEFPCFVFDSHADNIPPIVARWSGPGALTIPPAIGTRVFVTMNGFGPGIVTGYFVESGFMGLEVKPDKRPDWHIKQNPRQTTILIFSAEVCAEGESKPARGEVKPALKPIDQLKPFLASNIGFGLPAVQYFKVWIHYSHGGNSTCMKVGARCAEDVRSAVFELSSYASARRSSVSKITVQECGQFEACLLGNISETASDIDRGERETLPPYDC